MLKLTLVRCLMRENSRHVVFLLVPKAVLPYMPVLSTHGDVLESERSNIDQRVGVAVFPDSEQMSPITLTFNNSTCDWVLKIQGECISITIRSPNLKSIFYSLFYSEIYDKYSRGEIDETGYRRILKDVEDAVLTYEQEEQTERRR